MASKFYCPGGQQAERVRDLFATIAPRYDLVNDLQSFGLHRLWKRRLVRLASLRPGDLVLDLCCGTGDITFALARQGGATVGLDFSGPMLDVAKRRWQREVSGAISLIRGDALKLPFPENCFDVLTIGYGLRNLTDFQGGLREMLRVLRPGGRVLVLDFGKPANPVWRRLYFAWLRTAVPLLGKVFCGDSDTHGYILESLLNYPAQTGVAAALEAEGCTQVRIINLLGGIMSINTAEKPAAQSASDFRLAINGQRA